MKREVIIALIVFVSLFFLTETESQTVGTNLTVIYNNIPPILLSQIPNQTWIVNTNKTNAFDLDDYFVDVETLTYNFTTVENITIIINETTNIVSFYSDYNFSGTRNVTFIANDGYTTSNSNIVFLNVVQDTQAPTWSSASKNPINIFQNTIVTFTTFWQDNFNLDEYIFSANQLGSWVNYSSTFFSGTQNTSVQQLQISAPGGSTVQWRFFAYDEAGNFNATDIQNFTVNSTNVIPSGGGSSAEEETTGTTTTPPKQVERKLDYIIEPSESYTLEIKQGESGTISFKVTNIGNTDLEFNLEFSGLEEFKKALNAYSFNLTSGEAKTITAEFTAGEKQVPDIYFGKIKVRTKLGVKDILVAIIVKKFETDLELKVEIPPEYKHVKAGEKVRANITIESLKDYKERNISFYYSVNSFTGRVINSAQEQFSMRSQKIVLQKELEIPEETYIGEHIFFARAVTEQEIAIDSDTFQVGEKFSVKSLIMSNLILIAIIILSAIIALLIIKRRKNKERMRLLNLYMMITELNKLMKDGKIEEAIDLFVRIKSVYGEPLSKTAIKNRVELKKEMENLSQELNLKIFSKEIKQETKTSEKKEEKQEEKKPENSEEKKPEEKDAKKN